MGGPGKTVPGFATGAGKVGKWIFLVGEERARGEVAREEEGEGETSGVRIRVAVAGFWGCGEAMIVGSELMVRVSEVSRECEVEERKSMGSSEVPIERLGRRVVPLVPLVVGLEFDLEGTSGGVEYDASEGGVDKSSFLKFSLLRGGSRSKFGFVGSWFCVVVPFCRIIGSSLPNSLSFDFECFSFSLVSLFPIKSG